MHSQALASLFGAEGRSADPMAILSWEWTPAAGPRHRCWVSRPRWQRTVQDPAPPRSEPTVSDGRIARSLVHRGHGSQYDRHGFATPARRDRLSIVGASSEASFPIRASRLRGNSRSTSPRLHSPVEGSCRRWAVAPFGRRSAKVATLGRSRPTHSKALVYSLPTRCGEAAAERHAPTTGALSFPPFRAVDAARMPRAMAAVAGDVRCGRSRLGSREPFHLVPGGEAVVLRNCARVGSSADCGDERRRWKPAPDSFREAVQGLQRALHGRRHLACGTRNAGGCRPFAPR
jgi:hypothetical protein